MTITADQLPHLMDVATLADHLGVEIRHIRRLVHERRIPFLKWGHLIRFDPNDVDAWLAQCRTEARRPIIGPNRPA